MASALPTALTTPQTDHNRPVVLTAAIRARRRFVISCSSGDAQKTQSLSEQLRPLSSTTLADAEAPPLPTPKSTWVNPARPRRSALSLHRQKRSSFSRAPAAEGLRQFVRKLNGCDLSEAAFAAALDEIPEPPTPEDALLVLNALTPWQRTLWFFNWVKEREFFPVETIFYNVTIKALRSGKQFRLVEELAQEMIAAGVELDNITYSTIITCAKRCGAFDKAVQWFERIYETGSMPDEVTYSAILDVYAKLGKVEEVLSLYERGRASGWTPDPVTFSVLGKMFGEAGNYDGIRYVLEEMTSLGVKPNIVVYNSLLEATGRAGKPHLARNLFEEMTESGLTPNEKTLTTLLKVYGKARWGRDAMELWEKIRSKGWPVDIILYNTLLNMCADLGYEEHAETLFQDMKKSPNSKSDSWSYTAMLNIYGSGNKVDKAMELFEEMCQSGVELNVMGCTCLIRCFGKNKRIDDMVRVFDISIERGINPDDRLCGCLLSVACLCEDSQDFDKVIGCLQRANPKLVAFIELLEDEGTGFDTLKEEFRRVISRTEAEARRAFCNCLIDLCRKQNLNERAHELLYLGTLYGLYPGLHNKTAEEWSLDVRSLSVGAAHTALEEWMATLYKLVQREEALPELFSAQTGTGSHRLAQGLANAFASHVDKLAAPFRQSAKKAGYFVATREDLVSWVQSRVVSPTVVG